MCSSHIQSTRMVAYRWCSRLSSTRQKSWHVFKLQQWHALRTNWKRQIVMATIMLTCYPGEWGITTPTWLLRVKCCRLLLHKSSIYVYFWLDGLVLVTIYTETQTGKKHELHVKLLSENNRISKRKSECLMKYYGSGSGSRMAVLWSWMYRGRN